MGNDPGGYRYPHDCFPFFDGPVPHPRFYKMMYDVSGETRVESHLITLARGILLSHVRTDEHLAARLQDWSASIGLPAIEHDIADFLDRVARRLSLSRRGDLARHRRTPDTLIEDFLPEWDGLQDRLYAAYGRAGEVVDAAWMCIRDELQLPCPWLAFRLTYDLFDQAHERALGATFIRQRTSYLDDCVYGPFVPHVTFPGFETTHGERLDEAIQRYMDAVREHCNTLRSMAIGLPKGVLRKDHEGNTRRNVRWVYEHRVCQKRRYQIAKAYHAERPNKDHDGVFPRCSCYQNVKDGIKDAERLLGMSPDIF